MSRPTTAPRRSGPATTMTRDLAYAVSKDAGNRSMRQACRTKWNRADYNAACGAFERVWSIEQELTQRALEATGIRVLGVQA